MTKRSPIGVAAFRITYRALCRLFQSLIKNKKMNRELSAGTTDEQSTKDDNQHVSPACIKPIVSGCTGD